MQDLNQRHLVGAVRIRNILETLKCIGVSSRSKITKVESISIRGLHDRGIETLAKGDAKRDPRSGDYWHNTFAKTIEKR